MADRQAEIQALADKYARHADEEIALVDNFANCILDLGGDIEILYGRGHSVGAIRYAMMGYLLRA